MIYDLRFTIWARLLGLIAVLHPPSAIFMAHAQPTNPPVTKLVSVTVGTNSVLAGYGTNLFSTNLNLIRAAGIVAPTNSGSEGYVPVTRGNQTKWEATAGGGVSVTVSNGLSAVTNSGLVTLYDTYAKQPAAANLTNWAAVATNAFVLSPTNSGGDGQVVSKTGNQNKWITSGGEATNAIANLDGFGTNTTLYFNTAVWGTNNIATGPGNLGSAILSGFSNHINAGDYGVISGGRGNWQQALDYDSAIGGGLYNIQYNSPASVISGGRSNYQASAGWSVIGGGHANIVGANFSTIPGGWSNGISGTFSFAAGTGAKATNNGVFIWSDNISSNGFYSTSNNQFLVRASGGMGINTNNPGTNALKVVGNIDSTVGFSINGVPIQAGGGGGGIAVSNTYGVSLVSGITYTNATDYSMLVNAMGWYNYDNFGSDLSFVFNLDTNRDSTIDFSRPYHQAGVAGNDINFPLIEMIPPGAAFQFVGTSNDASFFASIIANSGTLSHFLPAGGGGGGNPATNLLVYTTSGNYGLELREGGISYAAFDATNIVFDSALNVGNLRHDTSSAFAGPTNILHQYGDFQLYTTTTDVGITNLDSVISGRATVTVLRLNNTAGADKTLTLPATFTTPDGLRSYTLTNGQVAELTVTTYGIQFTNAVLRHFY